MSGERVNSDKIILHLCAEEGSDSKPYQDAGYDVRIIGENIGVENYTPPANVYGIIANPPCTMFSIARTRAKTPRNLSEGMRLIKECLRIIWECQYQCKKISFEKPPLKFWALENPASGYLKWFLGHPVFSYNQAEYGAPFNKTTALWGLFNSPQRPFFSNEIVGDQWLRVKSDRERLRSMCPEKFAQAFFEANP